MGFRHRWPKRDNALVSLGRHLIVPSRLSLASFRIQLDQNIILRNGRRRACDQREQGSSELLHSLSPLTDADRLMLFPWTYLVKSTGALFLYSALVRFCPMLPPAIRLPTPFN